jgi:hypothetical protein
MALPGEFDPERVAIQAASTDPDPRSIEALVGGVLRLAHAESEWRIGPAEPSFGWYFYILSISREAVRRLAQLPDGEIMKMKGETLEQKLVSWLNRQAKKNAGDSAHFTLLSDLKSSRYGLF